MLRHGGDVVLRGLGGCRFEPTPSAARHRPPAGLDDGLQRDLGGLEQAADPRLRPLPRARRGPLRRQLAAPARRVRGPVRRPRSSLAPGYCTLSMLFSDWSHTGQRDLRVSNDRHYYIDGEEQLWRMAPGQPPTAVHRGRRLAPAADLGHGHRQPGHHRRRPPRGVPHEPGRQQAADAGQRPGPARLPRHRAEERRDRAAALRRRRRAAVDGVASGVRRREQRRHRRPARHQGQRRRPDRAGHPRPEQPVHRPGPTARSSRAPRPQGSSATTGRAAPPWSTSTSTGCSTWSS